MKKFLVLILLASASPAFAQDEDNTACQKASDDVWICPMPAHPVGPPKCYVFGKSLVCSQPLSEATPAPVIKPSNCGWTDPHERDPHLRDKQGKYKCF